MSLKRITQISIIISICLLMFINSCGAEGEIIFQANSIDLDNGYLTATDGFELWIDGNYLSGQEVYYDMTKGEYHFHQVGFTTCKLAHPHYQIQAKKIHIFKEDKLVLSGAKLRLGESITIPIPFQLVLEYREGRYQFPDWIPRIVYSTNDGLGLEFNGAATFSNKVNLTGKFLLMFKGTGEFDVKVKYLPGDLELTSNIAYNKNWSTKLDLDWRKGKEGLGGDIDWSYQEDLNDEKNLGINYRYLGYQSKLGFQLIDHQLSEVLMKINTPKHKLGILDYQIGIDYINNIAEDRDYTRSYLLSNLSDYYRWSIFKFGWSLKPTQYLILDYGLGGKLHSNLWLETPLNENLSLRMEYRKSNRWGNVSDDLIDYLEEEYAEGKITYHDRNDLDEGWDLELAGKYDLDQQRFTEATTKIVKAYDCFNVEVTVDILEEIFDLGIKLKY